MFSHDARPTRVLAVVGATATGKTALAEGLADALQGEVICADSRQVFRELEVGTGKPTPAERAIRAHHLFDALELGDRASAGWYARASRAARTQVRSRDALPLLVGGSGLYLRAAQEGLAEEPPHDPAVRARLRGEIEVAGPEALHARLATVDPPAARRLAPRDRQRILRALEVYEASGKPLSWWWSRPVPAQSGETWTLIEVVLSPGAMGERIAARTRWMLDNGLIEETRRLLAAGRGPALRALRAVGYDEAIEVVEGSLGLKEAMERINLRTGRLAKRQRTWFRHQARALRLDADGLEPPALLEAALEALAGPGAALP
jgi:tRNA dimethylallyltransferase